MKRIQINDLFGIDGRYLLDIYTISNNVFTCRKRNTSTTSPCNNDNHNGIVGTLGYIVPTETEKDIYDFGLELDRSIDFNQIKEIYIVGV